jgi:hypothetical protein
MLFNTEEFSASRGHRQAIVIVGEAIYSLPPAKKNAIKGSVSIKVTQSLAKFIVNNINIYVFKQNLLENIFSN